MTEETVLKEPYWKKRHREQPEKVRYAKWKHNLKKKYGLTPDEWDELYQKQSGLCAICGMSFGKLINVDHCHRTGIVRGLLCTTCNTLLGNAKDSMEVLTWAIEYLQQQTQTCEELLT